jgi:hypothetical protein
VPREPAWLTSGGMDAEAQAASSERRPGRPQRASGDGARAAPPGATDSSFGPIVPIIGVVRAAPAERPGGAQTVFRR